MRFFWLNLIIDSDYPQVKLTEIYIVIILYRSMFNVCSSLAIVSNILLDEVNIVWSFCCICDYWALVTKILIPYKFYYMPNVFCCCLLIVYFAPIVCVLCSWTLLCYAVLCVLLKLSCWEREFHIRTKDEVVTVMFKPSSDLFCLIDPRQCFFFVDPFSYSCLKFSLLCCLVCSLQPCDHLLGNGWPLGSLVCLCHFSILSSGSGIVLVCVDLWPLPSSCCLFYIAF